jgi:hypothetical protein
MEIVDEQNHMRKGRGLTCSEGIATVGLADFVRRVVTTIKPRLAVENRAESGFSLALAQGLNDNGFGRLIVCDPDVQRCLLFKKEIPGLGLSPAVSFEVHNQSALETKVDGAIDLLVCSTDHEQAVRHLLGQINPFGLVLLFANEANYDRVRQLAITMDREGIFSVVLLPANRKLIMAQKRSGRT